MFAGVQERTIDWLNHFMILPLEQSHKVRAGDVLAVQISYRAGGSIPSLQASIKICAPRAVELKRIIRDCPRSNVIRQQRNSPFFDFSIMTIFNELDASLDPENWGEFRAQGHRMLDDMLDYVEHIRDRPVWQPIPPQLRRHFQEALPSEPSDLASVHASFLADVLPYSVGNVHPRFMGWVHGGGTPVGMLAEMLAGGLNANVGGRDQMPLEVERQVVHWMRELFGFPANASGVFVTGTSMANFMGLLIARNSFLGADARRRGPDADGAALTAYTSVAAHGSMARAMEMAGLGSDALRRIAVNSHHEIDLAALEQSIAADRALGLRPFFIAASAGTVDIGAVDNLGALAALAKRESLWLHVDGAYGALGMLSPDIAPRLAGIELADSLAFDFHKWGQVPYDAGFLLVRDGREHEAAFASPAAYLQRENRGLAGGSPWPCDFGPDLSRGFRALKTWMTFKVYGAVKLGAAISETCRLARYMRDRIALRPELELMAPVSLNIVCFRYRSEHANADNREIVADLHESGIAVPSTTTIAGQLVIRTALVNHRTKEEDVDALLDAVVAMGARRCKENTGY